MKRHFFSSLAIAIILVFNANCTGISLVPTSTPTPIPTKTAKPDTATPIPTNTSTPTPTITSSPIPITQADLLEIKPDQITTYSHVDLREEIDEDLVLIPRTEGEYLLSIKIMDSSFQESRLLVNNNIIEPLKEYTNKEKNKLVFFSIPRGGPTINLQFPDGSTKILNEFLPEVEPENFFFSYEKDNKYKYKDGTFKIKRCRTWTGFGYREGAKDSVHWLPDLPENELYFVVDLYENLGNIYELKKIGKMTKIIFPEDVLKQQSPDVVPMYRGSSSGELGIAFGKIPITQSRLYVYFPGIGILNTELIGGSPFN